MLYGIVVGILLVGWSLKEGNIYWKEAAAWVLVIVAVAVGIGIPSLLIPTAILGTLALVVLVVRVFGSDVFIR